MLSGQGADHGAQRAVAGPVSFLGKSISEDVNGLAFRFEANVAGFAIKAGTFVQADYTNATYNGYKLVKLGVIASNGVSETNIEGLRMYDLEDGNAKFAFRVINIPADKLDVEITMTPYYIVEIDGEIVTLFHASEGKQVGPIDGEGKRFVTDGPFMWRCEDGTLLMLFGRLEIFGLVQLFFIKWWR